MRNTVSLVHTISVTAQSLHILVHCFPLPAAHRDRKLLVSCPPYHNATQPPVILRIAAENFAIEYLVGILCSAAEDFGGNEVFTGRARGLHMRNYGSVELIEEAR